MKYVCLIWFILVSRVPAIASFPLFSMCKKMNQHWKHIQSVNRVNSVRFSQLDPPKFTNTLTIIRANFCRILQNNEISFYLGPSLPGSVYGAKPMVQHPNGGFLVYYTTKLYMLPHAEATSWTTLTQVIKKPRYWTIAFLVPDDIVSCV
jgi:hypothetical protein